MTKFMNFARWTTGSVFLTAALAMGVIGIASSDNDSDEWDDDDEYSQTGPVSVGSDAAMATYQEECAACHIAYPAQLLPARSWSAILSGLEDHFGENAELMPATYQPVEDYLMANAADRTASRLGRKALSGLRASATPLRITSLPFYTRQHDEVPDRYVTGNPEVGSFSQCQACHGDGSERGIFDEDTVKIPGVGDWDD